MLDRNSIKLIILDRDGVVNFDSDAYIKSPDEWKPIPGSLSAIKQLNDAGFIVTIATNQSGVGRKYFSFDTLGQIHQKMHDELMAHQAHLDALVFCPHTPEDQCDCRKPQPGMLWELLEKFSMQPHQSVMVGDNFRDLEAAWAVGCEAVLVKTGKGEKTLASHADALKDTLIFNDLAAFVTYLLNT